MTDERLEITKGEANVIEAEFVNVKQSTVQSVEGGHVELQQVGALTIYGEKVDVTQGATFLLRGEKLTLNQSISVITAAEDASLNFSFSPVSLAKERLEVNRSAVGVMVSKELKTEGTSSIIMIAKNIEGNVTTLLDWRSALALGAVFGGIFGLFKLLRKK